MDQYKIVVEPRANLDLSRRFEVPVIIRIDNVQVSLPIRNIKMRVILHIKRGSDGQYESRPLAEWFQFRETLLVSPFDPPPAFDMPNNGRARQEIKGTHYAVGFEGSDKGTFLHEDQIKPLVGGKAVYEFQIGDYSNKNFYPGPDTLPESAFSEKKGLSSLTANKFPKAGHNFADQRTMSSRFGCVRILTSREVNIVEPLHQEEKDAVEEWRKSYMAVNLRKVGDIVWEEEITNDRNQLHDPTPQ